jgi:Zn-dependent peptidase ImmA (M78 family)
VTPHLDAKTQGEQDAEKVLALMGVRMPPVSSRLAAQLVGVAVEFAELDPEINGFFACERGRDPRIVVNNCDGEWRQRFTIAHELAHHLRFDAEVAQTTHVQYRNRTSREGRDPEEIYANAFAVCLLMPAYLVTAFVRQGLSSWEIATKFQVSRETAHYRLRDLGLV